jgi:hypothetical protein
MEPVFQQQPQPFTLGGGCDDLTDDEDIEARGLDALEQLHVELQEKKRCIDALERQGSLRDIRQKANEAREQLQRLDEYLTVMEAGVDAQAEPTAMPQHEHQWHNLHPRHSPPLPPPPNLNYNNLCFHQLYPWAFDQHEPHQHHRN